MPMAQNRITVYLILFRNNLQSANTRPQLGLRDSYKPPHPCLSPPQAYAKSINSSACISQNNDLSAFVQDNLFRLIVCILCKHFSV